MRVALVPPRDALADARLAENERRRREAAQRDIEAMRARRGDSVQPTPVLTQRTIAAVIVAGPPRPRLDVDELRRLVVDERKSDAEVAAMWGCHRSAISQARARYGISQISRAERMRRHYETHPDVQAAARREHIRELLESGMLGADVARRLGVSKALVCITRRALGLAKPDLAISHRRSVQASADARRGKHRNTLGFGRDRNALSGAALVQQPGGGVTFSTELAA